MHNLGTQTAEITTTNNTQTTAVLVHVPNNGAGEIKVRMVALDTTSTKLIHGEKALKFEKIAGTLAAVGSIVDTIAITISDLVNNTGATFTIDVSGEYLRVRVTGNTGRTII
jgi:hypothetical protein